MIPTTALIIAALVMLGAFALFAFSLMRISARADRRASRRRVEYLNRYVGGERPCVVCGEPTPYSLKGEPMHAHCRKDV